MSFVLNVYLRHFSTQIDREWMARFAHLGLDCVFPPGYSLLTTYDIADPVICTVREPMVPMAWPSEETGLAVDEMPVEPHDVEIARGHQDPRVRELLPKANLCFCFSTSAGRADIHLLMQCYGAAALAEVGNGVLIDEDGEMAYGGGAYSLARKHTECVFRTSISKHRPVSKHGWWRQLLR